MTTNPNLDPYTNRNAFLITGAVGLIVGTLYGAWHLGMEGAQAVSGTIDYPPWLPYAWYFRNAWTFIHQITVPILWMGLDMAQGSVLLSMLTGLLYVQGLSLTAYGLSGRLIPSLLLALVALHNNAFWYNPDYSMEVFSGFSNGVFGQGVLLYAIGLASIGWGRGAAILIGFLPAIHITNGAWAWSISALTVMLFQLRLGTPLPRRIWFGFVWGMLGMLASFLLFRLSQPTFPVMDPDEIRHYFEAYMTTWEFKSGHRNIGGDPLVTARRVLHSLATVMALAAASWGLYQLRAMRSTALLAALALSGLCASGLFLIYKGMGEQLPLMVSVLMPGRFFNPLMLPALMLFSGLLLARLGSLGAMGLLFSLHAMAILANKSPKLAPEVATIAFAAAALALTVLLLLERRPPPEQGGWLAHLHALCTPYPGYQHLAKGLYLALLAMALINSGLFLYRGALHTQGPRYPAWENVPDIALMRIAGSKPGIIATAGNPRHIAAWTGRAPIIEGTSLNLIPYVPEAGPSMARILTDLYGIDFFNPPGEVFSAGGYGLAPQSGKKLWQERSPNDWQVLANRYQLSFALTPKTWVLKLSRVGIGERFALYRMPPRNETSTP
ncbi:MAG: hypothetical protein HQL53_05475 [Magnetococcales bacterium]|nr:hypothetical protein [Magnetococcales bacterium]